MKFIPSLLEYSTEQLIQKLNLVANNFALFKNIQQTNDIISFHLDFVLPQFARDRKVMTSLSLATVLEKLEIYFKDTPLDLSVHFMGTIEDLYDVNNFLKDQAFNPKWKYTFYVPANFTTTFIYHSQIYTNVEIGIWYDKDLWDSKIIEKSSKDITRFLLMTVVAGKSGQKLTSDQIQKVEDICTTNPKLDFLADGGWPIDCNLQPNNLEIISYTSFWKAFEEKLKLDYNS